MVRTPMLAALLLGATAWAATAQPRPSQHGAVSQTVNETVLTVEYDRPSARGRDLFGGILDWDSVWTPGANRATWIDLSTDAVVQGTPVAAGRYGIWMIPRESEPWDLILVGEWDTHHSYFPFETEVLKVKVSAGRAQHMEVLSFYFPVVESYGTELRMHWGETVVPLRIEVPR